MRGTKTSIERMDEAGRINETDRQLMAVEKLTQDNATLIAENARLKGEVEKKSTLLKIAIEDSCDDDTKIRDLCRPIIGEKEADHDGYGVIPLVTVVERTIQAHKDALKEAKAGLWKINTYPVHSEPVGGAMAMQDIANDTLATINKVMGETEGK